MGLIAGDVVIGDPELPPNSPPEWTGTPAPNWTAGVGGTFDLGNFTTDVDGDTLTYTHDVTSTALPTAVTLASNGILTATTSLTAGSSSNIRFKINDGVNSLVTSPNITITGNTAGTGHRWNPGHYVRINGDPLAADQEAWFATAASIANANLNEANFKGMVCGIAWGRVNPTGTTYDFSDIYDLLDICAANGNKKLILLPTYKSFGSAPATYHTPADLRAGNIIQFANGNGRCAAVWRDGTGGFDNLRDRFAQCMVAIVNEFDAHPNFEMLSQVEAITSLQGYVSEGVGTPLDFTDLKMYNAVSYIYQQVEAAVVKMNYAPMHNTLGSYTAQIVQDFYDLGIMMGSPDAREVTGYNNFEGIGSIASKDYRNEMGAFTMATHSVLSATRADYDPDFVINNEQGHETTHLAWDVWLTEAGKAKANILSAITADPLLHTACPTIYSACDV